MKSKLTILVWMAILISLPACGGMPGVVEDQALQVIPIEEDLTQSDTPNTDLDNPYSYIQEQLRAFPPCAGYLEERKDVILSLDAALKEDAARWDPGIMALYQSMMGVVETEISEPLVSGVRIWSMYNHGFILKTPGTIIAFDLVHGYPSWGYQIPETVLAQIDVLFITHRHEDHLDRSLVRAVLELGGQVVMPVEDKLIGYDLVYLGPNEQVVVAGLQITAHDGLHGGIPVRMYEVTTSEGVTVLHTGDNQTSETLPEGLRVDILLLNAWVNEGGGGSTLEGTRNSIMKIEPKLTVLGHILEMSHEYDPASVTSRLSFEGPLTVMDESLPGEVSVQIWGERCDFNPD